MDSADGIETRETTPSGWRVECAVLLIGSVLAAAAYTLLTNHIWEDFFITFKYSKNLAEGKGLVYFAGERVHGFTSPLGVMLPAFLHWILGAETYEPALNTFRVLSILALSFGGVFCLRALQQSGVPRVGRWFFIAFFICEAKSIAFATNGMESGWLLLFLGLSLWNFVRGCDRHWLFAGASWAGLMYSRPDGCVLILGLMLATWFFSERRGAETRKGILKAAAVCALLYLPWFIGVWVYYGTPVPHTIVAKSGGYERWTPPPGRMDLLWNAVTASPRRIWDRSAEVYQPIYAFMGGWPAWVAWIARAVGLFSTIYWLIPSRDRAGRGASLAFAICMLYYLPMPLVFPWYYPPASVFGLYALASMIGHVGNGTSSEVARWSVRAGGGLVAAFGVYLTVSTTIQMREQQARIEFGNRRRIGEWIASNSKPEDTVYTECFGYVGYFSNRKIYDFPGLVSPEVVRLRREKDLAFHTIIPELEPTFVVARGHEYLQLSQYAYFVNHYEKVLLADARPVRPVPGDGFLRFDTIFVVCKRKRAE